MTLKNTTIHCRPTHDNVIKSHRTITVTRQQENNFGKATISLILSKLIEKLERKTKYCITKQGPNTRPPQTIGATIKKTEPAPENEQPPKQQRVGWA